MLNALPLSNAQRQNVVYWLPALAAGVTALLVFLTLGNTPFVRAAGLAASVAGVGLTLRRFGSALAFIGAMAIAFAPAFWSQTGGSVNPSMSVTGVLMVLASIGALVLMWLGKRPNLGLAAGVIIFVLLFWVLVGTPRSLRLTTFMSAWLLYLLVDALLTSNPRPDENDPVPLKAYHTLGMLLLLALGILNDPLFILIAPAVILGLWLSRTRLPWWYWGVLLAVLVIGIWGVADQYFNSSWWTYPAARAEAQGIRVPFMMADGWREAPRWISLLNLVSGQFTIVGLLLGVLGLSRLARWYPPLGVVTMIAYATYALFGLVYFGRDSAVLLLPLLMIQVVWMTYAVYTFGQWLQKSQYGRDGLIGWAAPVAFVLLPLLLLFQIVGGR